MPAAIEIRGIDQAIAKLGKAGAVTVLIPAMQRAVLRLQREMAGGDTPPMAYPQYRGIENSTYRRQGTLGRKWTVRVISQGNGLRGVVGNNTWYAPLVQSSRYQTQVHRRHGWITDAQAINRNAKAITADFDAAIKKATA